MKRAPIPPTRNRRRTVRNGGRRLALLASLPALLGGAALGCAKAAPPAAAPEVYVTDVVQKDVPVYMELVGQTKGSQDVEIRARVEGYLESRQLHRGHLRHEGHPPLPDRPQAARGGAGATPRRSWRPPRPGSARTNNDVARYRPLAEQQAVTRQELDNAISAQEAARAMVDAAKAARRQGHARPRLRADHVAPSTGLVGTTQRQGGQPRRPRREHAAHDGLPGRPDPLPRRASARPSTSGSPADATS